VTVRLWPLRLLYALVFAALGVYLPFFPRWLEARGVTGLAMGAVSATLPAMSVLGPPIFGAVADRLGVRGAMLRIATGGAAVGFALLALLARGGSALGLAPLFAVTLLVALFRSPVSLLADVLAMEQAAAGGTTYPRLRLWGSLGFLGAVVAAGRWLDPAAPVALPALVALAMALATVSALALPARVTLPARPALGEARALLASADYRLFLAAGFLSQTAHSVYDLCFSLHLRDLGSTGTSVGVAWAIGVVAEVVLMASWTPARAARAAPPALALGLALASARWALLAVVRSPGVVLALQPLHAASFALVWISCISYTKSRSAPHLLATSQGLFLAAVGLGSVVGMLGGGALYRASGGGAAFGGASIAAAMAFATSLAFARRARGAPAEAAPRDR
jgi:PPP family 3-phenylpropionic acid transporter